MKKQLKRYRVYLMTNKRNGKKYIGCTKLSMARRFQSIICRYTQGGVKNYKDFYTDNKAGFKIRILRTYSLNKRKQAFNYEQKLSIKLNTNRSKKYYNIVLGGYGISKMSHTLAQLKSICKDTRNYSVIANKHNTTAAMISGIKRKRRCSKFTKNFVILHSKYAQLCKKGNSYGK